MPPAGSRLVLDWGMRLLLLLLLPAAAGADPRPARQLLGPDQTCPPGYREVHSPLWGRWAQRLDGSAHPTERATPAPLAPPIVLPPAAWLERGPILLRARPAPPAPRLAPPGHGNAAY